ncbi:MAG: AlpA family phage regulatory protein, partial [Rhodanobacteraceae bacterium]|nr:AlpA family phage regulatory protein [Rhodanobacteraceae bacterium]
YRKIGDRTFPSAIALSIHSVAWLESEVEAWIGSRVAASRPEGAK